MIAVRPELYAAMLQLLFSFAASDDGQSLDEAMVWEPAIERCPLITFGDMRRLLAAARPDLPGSFDAHVEAARREWVAASEFR